MTAVESRLPPGYEDHQWCKAGDCSININPYGDSGPLSSFEKCYSRSTYTVYEAVWTGTRSDTTPPRGWEEDPEDCPDGPTPAPQPQPTECFPSTTTKSGYKFESEGLHSKCDTGASSDTYFAEDAASCAKVCADKGDLSTSLLLMGFNFNCRTQDCTCQYGTKWETIDGFVDYANGNTNAQCYAVTPFPRNGVRGSVSMN